MDLDFNLAQTSQYEAFAIWQAKTGSFFTQAASLIMSQGFLEGVCITTMLPKVSKSLPFLDLHLQSVSVSKKRADVMPFTSGQQMLGTSLIAVQL